MKEKSKHNTFRLPFHITHERVFLFGILFLAGILRFYAFPLRYGLGDETCREAFVAIEGARQLQFPLVGAFSSAGPFTFGPWFWYLLILFQLVVNTPYAAWIFLGITSVTYVFIAYKIGEKLQSKTLGLIIALLTALSPALIIGATHLTMQNVTGMYASLSILLFVLLLKKRLSYWWSFLFGFILGVGINHHYQMGGLLILPVLLFIAKPRQYWYGVTSLVGVALPFLPMLFFEVTNHWFNLRNFVFYVLYGKNALYVPNRWLFYLRDFWPAFWADTFGIPQWLGQISMAACGVLGIWAVVKKRISKELGFLIIAFLINFILLRYYWGERFFGYLSFIRPFVLIFMGLFLYSLTKIKYGILFTGVIIIGFTFFAYPRILDLLAPDVFSREIYEQVAALEKQYPNNQITVYSCKARYSGPYSAKTSGFVFALYARNKLSENTVRIGVASQACVNPSLSEYSMIDGSNNRTNAITGTSLLDFSDASESALAKAGWKAVSPKTVFEETTRWWFDEKP